MGMREIAPFGVRMSPELKARLEAAAKINGRSLNAEVVARLQESLDQKGEQRIASTGEPSAAYRPMSDGEQKMLALYRRWSPEQQLSFLVLFK